MAAFINAKFPGLLTLCQLQVGTEIWKEGSATFFRVNQSNSGLLGLSVIFIHHLFLFVCLSFTAGRVVVTVRCNYCRWLGRCRNL